MSRPTHTETWHVPTKCLDWTKCMAVDAAIPATLPQEHEAIPASNKREHHAKTGSGQRSASLSANHRKKTVAIAPGDDALQARYCGRACADPDWYERKWYEGANKKERKEGRAQKNSDGRTGVGRKQRGGQSYESETIGS